MARVQGWSQRGTCSWPASSLVASAGTLALTWCSNGDVLESSAEEACALTYAGESSLGCDQMREGQVQRQRPGPAAAVLGLGKDGGLGRTSGRAGRVVEFGSVLKTADRTAGRLKRVWRKLRNGSLCLVR